MLLLLSILVLAVVYRRTSFLILAVTALVGLSLVSFRQAALNNQFLQSKIGTVVRLEGVVTTDPVLKEGLVIGSYRKPDQLSALFKLIAIDGKRTQLPLRIRFNPTSDVEIDQNLIVNARLVKSKERKVAALAIANGEIIKIGEPRNLFRITSKIRDDFRTLASDSNAGALIPGLVLGDTSLQTQSFIEQMRRVGLSWIVQSISIPVSATIFCLPVIVLLSNQISLVSVPANILVAPVIAPITLLGFVAAIFAPVTPFFSAFLLLLATPFAHWIVIISQLMADLPAISFNRSFIFFLVFVAVLIGLIIRRKLLIYLAILFIAIQLITSHFAWPGSGWQIANCDVGQGDGLVVNLGEGNAIVVDVGPEPEKMDQCLKKLGIRSIPLLILTHFHSDHVGGISKVLQNRKVTQVWISNLAQPEAAYQSTMKELSGIDLKIVEQGERYLLPKFATQVLVLWPKLLLGQMPTLPGDGSAVNNSSISVIIKTKTLSIFAGGDIEPAAQEMISSSGYLSQVDVLKVSHHGSAYQYLPMLDLLNPKVAIISVGQGNSYGHPDHQFIAELISRHIKVWRTDQSGGISIATPNKIRVTGKEWWQIRWG
ncbi:MAG: MBL fold metallo-hydrolase [Actinobacteria bacterium]|nr:MBL fold metallo-hydrolase [Actinomycetota bacterium]